MMIDCPFAKEAYAKLRSKLKEIKPLIEDIQAEGNLEVTLEVGPLNAIEKNHIRLYIRDSIRNSASVEYIKLY
jgi:heptaprenylglyceryl phosphate synthase